MSARLLRQYCVEAGLSCRVQEVINWISRSRRADRHRVTPYGLPLTDVLSTFERPLDAPTRPAARTPLPTVVHLNPRFAEEWRQIIVLSALYGRAPATHDAQEVVPVPAQRVRGAVTRAGAFDLAQRVRQRGARTADELASFVRDHFAAWRVRRREPVMNAARRWRCPDCRR